MFRIEIVPEALEELRQVSPFYRRVVERAIETQLSGEPTRASKSRKKLQPLVARFVHEVPLWELRVGDWRVFYDVDEEEKKVIIRAIRRKPKEKRTEDIV